MFGTGDSIAAQPNGAAVSGSAVPGTIGGTALTTPHELVHLADGLVAVAIPRPNGLTGLDVFRAILDPRDAGVTVAGTAGADTHLRDASASAVSGGGGVDLRMGRVAPTACAGRAAQIGCCGAQGLIHRSVGPGPTCCGSKMPVAASTPVRAFTPGTDRTRLLPDGFGDREASTIAARFGANATATPAANGNAQSLFDFAGPGAGRLFLDAGGNGAGAAVLLATLPFTAPGGLASFGAADFGFL